ncbi:hypothetical protein HID58_029754 [Brassica napus]|uniref:Uncharacterized protein n=1 Tax=Brassica napus TaxID=3708 RepID=A0ABQ8CFM9_BRANA|nr:hypothetical protein HID58_029754 [Brassica napus]
MTDASMENEYGVNIVSLEMDRDAEASGESESERSVVDGRMRDTTQNSFVKQLYSLLGGEERRRLSTARDLQSNSHISTDDQFTVLQNGCRQKVNFGKKRPHLETSSSRQTPLGHEYPAQSTAEASGQNFREEVGEKECNSRASRKRRREANYDDSSLNDQDGEAAHRK